MNSRFVSIKFKLLVSFGVFLLALGAINFMYYMNASQMENSHREATAIQFLYRDLELKKF